MRLQQPSVFQCKMVLLLVLMQVLLYLGLRASHQDHSYSTKIPEISGAEEIASTTTFQFITVVQGNVTSKSLAESMTTIKNQAPGLARMLLVIRDTGGGCFNPNRFVAPNIQTICISQDHYSRLITDLLCTRWKCSPYEYLQVLESIACSTKTEADDAWSPLFDQIFANYLNPYIYSIGETRDVVYGNLSQLPKNVLQGSFDVIRLEDESHEHTALALKQTTFTNSMWARMSLFQSPAIFIKENSVTGQLSNDFWQNKVLEVQKLMWEHVPEISGNRESATKGIKVSTAIIPSGLLAKLQALASHLS